MNKLRIAYFGSPVFSAALLESLLNDPSLPVEIAFVVTQPDKPVGKKHTITPSPVKAIAQKYNIPCWDLLIRASSEFFSAWDSRQSQLGRAPTAGKKDGTGADLHTLLNSVDLALVFAYGFKELIPLDLLGAPKMHFDIGGGKHSGFINIHPSLLPLYRGSSPIAYPILLGDRETGVSLFVMDEKMDHGPLVARERTAVLDDKRPAMETLLTEMGTGMAKKLLTELAAGNQPPLIAQDHTKATRAPYMVKDDGYISFDVLKRALKNEPVEVQELPQMLQKYLSKFASLQFSVSNQFSNSNYQLENGKLKTENSPKLVYDFWRGMYPWPGVWTKVMINGQEKRLKLNEMKLENGNLSLTAVQIEGKNEVDFSTFRKAYGLF